MVGHRAFVQSHREKGLALPSGQSGTWTIQVGQMALKSSTFVLTPKDECRRSGVASEREEGVVSWAEGGR